MGNGLTGLVSTETDIEVGDNGQVVGSHQSETGQTTALVEKQYSLMSSLSFIKRTKTDY